MPSQSRRGGGEPDPPVVPLRGRGDDPGRRGGLSDARRYTPRGRSVRETGRGGRDPFRPALQVIEGGGGQPRGGTSRGGATGTGTTGRGSTSGTSSRSAASTTGRSGGSRSGTVRQPGARTAARAAKTTGVRRGGSGRPARRPKRGPVRPPRLGEPHRRLRLGTVLALAMFTAIAGRLVALQLTDAPAYAAAALKDRLTTAVIQAHRGAILDRDGAVLVHSVEARYVYADPTMVDDPAKVADQLFPLLGQFGVTRSELLAKLSRTKRADGRLDQFEYLARGVDISIGDAVSALNLKGIGVRPDERRDVPGHDLAANLIGFTNRQLSGATGLESAYDTLLRGVDGERRFETGVGNLDTEIPGGYHEEKPAKPGSSLQLTVDRDLQFEAQRILGDKMRQVQATFGCAVVLDVHTGEVLAQASYPTYDAADPYDSSKSQWVDVASQVVVDPGSVFKAVTLGAALQEGVVKPDSTVPVAPTIRKGDTTYADTHPFPAGTRLTIPGILAFSSNVGTITVAGQLGAQKLYDYQRKFGLGSATGEGMPNEAPGMLLPPDKWSGSSPGSIPIGMGVSVTPLQMAAVYAAIANGGTWVQPHLIKATIAPDGRATSGPAPTTRQVLSPSTAAALREAMEAVVTVPGATGRSAAIPGYRVSGKTGTGKYVKNGRYAPGEVASFIGMAPADQPRYVVAVFAYTPGGNGGVVAGPAFRDLMAFTLRHYAVPPTGTRPPTFHVTG
ncbi:MAG TPA: penicillin-binding protein 2 [Micromonosporaceae bacterium]